MRDPFRVPSHHACEALTATVVESTLTGDGSRAARRYPSGSAIWRPSDLPDRVFRLRTGRVHIVATRADGQEYLYRAVGPGELFGEMCFCDYRHEPHGSEARSIGRSEVWAVGYADFRRMLRDDVGLVDAVIGAFCTRVSQAEARARILARRDARARLAGVLVHLARQRSSPAGASEDAAALTISHRDLAAMAALSRPHVSVLMTEFRRRRLVSYRRGGPLRLDIARLRKTSGDEE